MLKEGKNRRVSTYRVYWVFEDQSGDEYIQALDAQQAVDFVRKYSTPDGAEIIDVAKVVKNWK